MTVVKIWFACISVCLRLRRVCDILRGVLYSEFSPLA